MYRQLAFAAGLIAFAALGDQILCAQAPAYPETRRVDQIDTYHGVVVADPYRWLEDMDGKETAEWAKAQDRILKDYVGDVPQRKALEARLLQMQVCENIWLPVRGGAYYFMQVVKAGAAAPQIHFREGLTGESRMLYDSRRDFNPNENPFTWILPSPDGRYIAILEGLGQSRWRRVRILDVASKRLLADNLSGLYTGAGGLSWTQDGGGFYYTRYEEPAHDRIMETTVRNSRIYYHKVGSPQTADWRIFETPDHPTWLFWPQVTFDNRYVIITEASEPNTRLFYKDITLPDADVQPLIETGDASYTFEGNVGDRFRISTTLEAPNGRLIEIDAARAERSHWVEIIPEDRHASLAAVGEIGGRLVMQYTKDAVPVIRVHSMNGDHLYDVDLPSIGLLAGFADDPGQTTALYRFNSLFDPGSTYSLNVHTGRSTIFSRPELPFDPDDFEMNQVFYRSSDGTRVPMFIAHRRDLEKSRSNPVFIYGYGSYKWSAFPWYQPHVLAWMEMGGVYALPGIRGGGEYGEAWYEAGRGVNKPNSIADFVAATEYLIEEGYSSPGRIVANGGSASGVVAGAALIERPDLFGAVVIDVPALDMLRYQLFGSGGSWMSEYGSSDDPEEFKALHSYSPYHNVTQGVCYPPVLTSVGSLDDTTAPMHGYKFTAAMQHAQACDHPIMLKVMWGAGHAWNLGISPEQRAETGADQLAFLIRAMKLTTPYPSTVARGSE